MIRWLAFHRCGTPETMGRMSTIKKTNNAEIVFYIIVISPGQKTALQNPYGYP